jgi:hypothetical protein
MIFHFYPYGSLQTLLAILTAKGDILTRNGSGQIVRVSVGLDGYQLTANSAKAEGIDWQAGTVAPVTSVFSRVGAVVAALSDYDASQIDNDSGVAGATVANALDALAAIIIHLNASDIGNDSSVAGADVAAALDTLLGSIGTKRMFFEAETNGNDSGHRVRNIGATGNFDFNFEVPLDFVSLVRLEMWGASRTTTNPAAPITLTSSYGVPPQAPNAISVAANITPALVAGQLFRFSLASVFAGLSAGAQCGVNLNHTGVGGSVDYYGIYLEYN